MKKSAVGILGGTFDPIHLGHIQLALSVYQSLQLQQLCLIPTNQPLLRKQPTTASAQQRFDMVQLAITDYHGLMADDRELKRGGYSYTIDTLASIRAENPTASLCVIIGVDQFSHFEQWREWQRIADLAHIIVTTRADFEFVPSAAVKNLLKAQQIYNANVLHQKPAGAIFLLELTPFSVSGTEIREKLAQGIDVSDKLPPKVWEYICENKLYR